MAMEVTFIRHGKTAGNLRGAYIGRTDEPLCAEGIAALSEKQAAGQYPAHAGRVFSSPLKRCVETARLLFPGVPMQTIADFRETDFGEFEGKSYQDLNGNSDYQRWIDSGGRIAFPGGEAPEAFHARCGAAFLALMEKIPEGETVTIVCHGGTIMAILVEFSEPHGDFYSWQVGNGDGFSAKFSHKNRKLTEITPLAGK